MTLNGRHGGFLVLNRSYGTASFLSHTQGRYCVTLVIHVIVAVLSKILTAVWIIKNKFPSGNIFII